MKKTDDPLAGLAKKITDRAMLDDTPFCEALDAFGKLTTYYGPLWKNRGRQPDDDPDTPTMDKFAEEFRQEGLNGRKRPRIQT